MIPACQAHPPLQRLEFPQICKCHTIAIAQSKEKTILLIKTFVVFDLYWSESQIKVFYLKYDEVLLVVKGK